MTVEIEDVVLNALEGFTVRDVASANWVVRKVVEARKYGEKVQARAAAELRRAQREEDFFLRRFGAELEEWARKQIEAQHDGRKSVSLPSGVVGFRTEQARLDVIDESALLAWRKSNLPTAIKTVDSIMKTTVINFPRDASAAGGETGDGGLPLCQASAVGLL